jgi:asparagine synthase (glutamine-hydrolysing)
MCGIWGSLRSNYDASTVEACLNALLPRGPEYHTWTAPHPNMQLGFTRLAINGLTPAGHQPFEHDDLVIVCNGEIYNYRQLAADYGIALTEGSSDCEVLAPLWRRLQDPTAFFRALDGVFAVLIVDKRNGSLCVGRDPYGVRPLFHAQTEGIDGHHGGHVWSSELKGIPNIHSMISVAPFPPGTWREYCLASGVRLRESRYHAVPWVKILKLDPLAALRDGLVAAVEKRLLSDRPVGALLSGGLDSSLVAAIAARKMAAGGQKLHTFSIGMPGSTDLAYAAQVAKHIGSEHHEILLTKSDFLGAVETVVGAIESYDITTVRASVGNWLVGRWIRENTDIKVVLNGDGSDEVGGGYLYFFRAPNNAAFEAEVGRLLEDIHMFDVLRSDRCIAAHGLEPRTPFLDKQFVATWLSIPTELRRPIAGVRVEKQVLREAFSGTDLLPDAVLWRKKEAFSDGVSSAEESWYQIVGRHAEECEQRGGACLATWTDKHNPPTTAEGRWYRRIFEDLYGAQAARCIPYMWMPRWTGATDPSARVLKDLY